MGGDEIRKAGGGQAFAKPIHIYGKGIFVHEIVRFPERFRRRGRAEWTRFSMRARDTSSRGGTLVSREFVSSYQSFIGAPPFAAFGGPGGAGTGQRIPSSGYGEKVTAAMGSSEYPHIMLVTEKNSSVIQNSRGGTFWEVGDKLKNYKNCLTFQSPRT